MREPRKAVAGLVTKPGARTRLVWVLFALTIAEGIAYFVANLLSRAPPFSGLLAHPLLFAFAMFAPVLLLVLHAFWTPGHRGLSLLLISFFLGLAFELLGMHAGIIFGGFYTYQAGRLSLFGVPPQVPIVWAGFIYTGYRTAEPLMSRVRGVPGKPTTLILSAVLGALLVVAIDVAMDPLQVLAGNWSWLRGGAFFGVPPANFAGWFLVAMLSLALFQFLEALAPQSHLPAPTSAGLLPSISYGLLGLCLAGFALKAGLAPLACVGGLFMFPVAAASFFLARRRLSAGAFDIDSITRTAP